MNNLGAILQAGLPHAKTRSDVISLCRQTLSHAEKSAYGHKLFIRYMQSIHLDYCDGPIDGLVLSGFGPTATKFAVGVAFIDPADVTSIYAGGAVCHPDDGWSKHLGKTIAILRACRLSMDTATHMAIRRAPWEALPITNADKLRSTSLRYPWSVLADAPTTFPTLALPAIIDAIRYTIRYNLGGTAPFEVSATTTEASLQPSTPLYGLTAALIDRIGELPITVPLTDTERAQRAADNRAQIAEWNSC